MSPKISIVIPVCNVEKYLARCLDSVLAQTLCDIEILCVDHSSTDGSLAILQEYAIKDDRIKIIPCVNTLGGPGQARNAGLDHVQSKYTYFLDSDDWIDTTLCEKAYYRLEQCGADVVFFAYHEVEEKEKNVSQRHVADVQRLSSSLAMPDYFELPAMPWNRVIRTDFLRKIDFCFPEGILPEDNFLHWALLVHEPKTEMILEKLYFYRLREGSQMSQFGEYVAKHCQVFSAIKQYLQNIRKYEQYRDDLLVRKYHYFVVYYPLIRKEYRAKAVEWLRETMDEDEVHFLMKEKSLSPRVRLFCMAALYGERTTWQERMWCVFHLLNRKVIRRFFIKPIESLLKEKKPDAKKSFYEQHIDELNELIAARDKEIVELRESFVLKFQAFPKKAACVSRPACGTQPPVDK